MYGLSQDISHRNHLEGKVGESQDFNYFDFESTSQNSQDDNNNNNNSTIGNGIVHHRGVAAGSVGKNGVPIGSSAASNITATTPSSSVKPSSSSATTTTSSPIPPIHHSSRTVETHIATTQSSQTFSQTFHPSSGVGGGDFLSSQNGSVPMSQLTFEDPEDMDTIQVDLPPHACRYCGLHDPLTVVRCSNSSCGKWFCNGKGKTSSAHIVNHLVKAKHNEISLHSDSPFGDTVLECYNCGCRNIFLLGFIPAKTESVVILLCRDPCAMASSKDNPNWDLSKWVPLVNGGDRHFLSWLVKVPSQADQERVRQISMKQIAQLEEDWKVDPNATLLEVEQHSAENSLLPTLLRYEDAYQYQEIITPLIKMESEYEKLMRESLSQDNVSVRWEQGLSKSKWFAQFSFSRSDFEFKVVVGDELKVSFKGDRDYPEAWESTGRITRIDEESEASMEITLELYNHNPPQKSKSKFKVDMVWRSTSFDRILTALKAFAIKQDAISSYLYHALLGHQPDASKVKVTVPQPTSFVLPGLPPLNASQISAACSVLKSPLSLIQGPPGTGKTVVSAFLVHHLVKHGIKGKEKLLVCAPSNVAIDQLAGKLHSVGLKVVRLCSKLREEVSSPVENLTLHHQVAQLDEYGRGVLRKFKTLREELGELNPEDERKFKNLKANFERTILKEADVICTTCVGAGDPRLKDIKFPYVLIDEATQASEPECLIPLVLGARQVVLVGDHCQLGPVLLCKKVQEAGLSLSLFERLIHLGHHPFRLTTQYRMHPALSEFPSNTFYEGQLVNEISYRDRVTNIRFPWPHPNRPMFFYNSTGLEEISSSGTSFINRTEASSCEKIVTRFLELGTKPAQIGIITPYEGQRSFLVNNMQRTGRLPSDLYKEIEVASVDSFQGREKDFIILSCVRSNENQGIGFLQDPRRLNVALTRARYGLIILGNARVLSRDLLWNNLISHFKVNEVLVEGGLQNLKQSLVILQKPRKIYGEGKLPVAGAPMFAPGDFKPHQIDPQFAQNMVYGQKPPKYYQGGAGFYPGMGFPSASSPGGVPRGMPSVGGPSQNYSTQQLTQGMGNMSLRYDSGSQSINGFSQQSSQQSSQSTPGTGYYNMSMPMSQSFSLSLNELSQDYPNNNSNNSQPQQQPQQQSSSKK